MAQHHAVGVSEGDVAADLGAEVAAVGNGQQPGGAGVEEGQGGEGGVGLLYFDQQPVVRDFNNGGAVALLAYGVALGAQGVEFGVEFQQAVDLGDELGLCGGIGWVDGKPTHVCDGNFYVGITASIKIIEQR